MAMLASAPSELSLHTERVVDEARAGDEDAWAEAHANESLDSFMDQCCPSTTEKSWISTSHEGRKEMIAKYYAELNGEDDASAGDESKGELVAAWEALETKCAKGQKGLRRLRRA